MEPISASFRDPSGFVFQENGVIFRQVNASYAQDYSRLMESGLYEALLQDGLLIPHEETHDFDPLPPGAFKILKPKRIPFISYPYEWTLSQLRDAALLTLDVQEHALRRSMCLKDATPYNVQFLGASPVFIDTLSFEALAETKPWAAYGQFCKTFLAPLVLARHCSSEILGALQAFPEGMPLDLAASLLPFRAKCNVSNFMHIVMHSQTEKRFQRKNVAVKPAESFTVYKHRALVDSLRSALAKISMPRSQTRWCNYYQETNYSPKAFKHKVKLVRQAVQELKPDAMIDLGANAGTFSALAPENCHTVSLDSDYPAVDFFYNQLKAHKQTNILPLRMDVCNPSPSLGWMNVERDSLFKRGSFDVMLALAIVHHLALGSNLSLAMIASFFQTLAKDLVVEFIPKEDSQAHRMLQLREDIFPDYHQPGFEAEFSKFFTIKKSIAIEDSRRTLYVMSRLSPDLRARA